MTGPIASLNAALRWDLADFQRGTRHIEMSFQKLLTLGRDMAAGFQQIGQQMTLGITAPMIALGAYTVNAASDLQELQSAFDFTFGSTAKTMNAWAESTGNAMGRATSEMKAGALAMGQLFKQAAPTEEAAARLSQRFTVLAQDAASFYNTSFDEALGKIRSGLSGESEPLRDFGVFLTEAAVKAKALELGMIRVGEELTEQGKIMARAILIQEGLADANGDVERTAGSFANRVRALKANIQELAEEIGERFLPYAERLVGWAQQAVEWIGNLPPGVKDAAVSFGILLAAIGPVMFAIGAMAATVLPLFIQNLNPIFVFLSALINPFGTAVVLLAKLAAHFGLVARGLSLLAAGAARFLGPWGLVISAIMLFSDGIGSALGKIGNMVADFLGPQVTRIIEQFGAAFSELGDLFRQIAESDLGRFLGEVFIGLNKVVEILLVAVGGGIIAGISALLGLIEGIAEYVRGVVQTVSKLLQGDWEGAWQSAGNTVARAAARIANLIRGVMPWLAAAIDQVARLSGDPTPMGNGQNARGGTNPTNASDVNRRLGFNISDNGAMGPRSRSYAAPATGGGGRSGGGGGGGRSGPSAEELAARREEIKLEQALAVARERGDIEGERALRRQLDLRSKIAEYERAKLSNADAKAAAEKDLLELDQARAEAKAREIAIDEESLDLQLAELRNDYQAIQYLKDKEYLRRQTLKWRQDDVELAEAELRAANDLKNLEEARADAIERRLAEQEDARQIELARIRGDNPARIAAMEEDRRIRARADELQSEYRMKPEDAMAKAMEEGADRSRAALQGTFRDTFRAGLQAAMNGDLGGFFKNWLESRSFDALSRVLDRLADGLANLVSGGGGGGGLLGALGSALGFVGAATGSGGGSAGITVNNKVASLQGYGGPFGTPKLAVPIGLPLPKFANGGWGRIKGMPGLDTNTLSLNGNPIAQVSDGELLNVQRASAAGPGNGLAVTVTMDPSTGALGAFVTDTAGKVVAEATPRIAALGASGAIQKLGKMNAKAL